ncbi:hypothetical protein [Kitasatospora fiedleri]|uniref:hypothetical protein n=1 Tax=Kitasatospora fiedleri TaxID=2991545 RepID=UPI00249BD68C|nr:hypothetical protein [Kitasatospora fiedleri]
MARADISAVQTLTSNGLTPTFDNANASGGQQFANNGRRIVRVTNTSGSAVTVTVNMPGTLDGVAPANGGKQVTIPATTGDVTIGPFPATIYNQTDGKVYLDFSATTNVKLAVMEMPQV